MSNTAYQKVWYEKNKDRHKANVAVSRAARRRELNAWIQSIKQASACADCAISYPYYVMQFDHLGEDKEKDVCSAVHSGWSRERILAEIAKCELVCANCHAERTQQRRIQA